MRRLPEENDEGEVWMECTAKYFNWMDHATCKCIPADYIFAFTDDDFACPTCVHELRNEVLSMLCILIMESLEL